MGQFPAANQTLSAATQAALKSALNARISSGSTGEWIIDLPSGDYGDLSLNDFRLPGKTILRSANRATTGAKFRSFSMERTKNVEFQFVKLDRVGQGRHGVSRQLERRREVRIPLLRSSTSARTSETASRVDGSRNASWGFRIWRDDSTLTRPRDITIYMNYIHGGADTGIYIGAADNITIAENVLAEIGCDDVHMGGGNDGILFKNNWGSRTKYPAWNSTNGWAHTDFCQMNTWQWGTENGIYIKNVNFIGNVVLKGNWDPSIGIPAQGLFASKSNTDGILYDNNIISANTPNAIMNSISVAGTAKNNRALFNTALRVIDDHSNKLHEAKMNIAGLVQAERNVHCGLAGSQPGNGLNIVMKNGRLQRQPRLLHQPVDVGVVLRLPPRPGQADPLGLRGRQAGRLRPVPGRDRARGIPEDRPGGIRLEGMV